MPLMARLSAVLTAALALVGPCIAEISWCSYSESICGYQLIQEYGKANILPPTHPSTTRHITHRLHQFHHSNPSQPTPPTPDTPVLGEHTPNFLNRRTVTLTLTLTVIP